MENFETQEELNDEVVIVRDRPTGLVILLILSTISSVFGLFSNLVTFVVTKGNVIPQEELTQAMQKISGMMGGADQEALKEFTEKFLEYGPALSAVGFLTCLSTLIAVVMMTRYKRAGFHIYTASRILEVAMPPLIAGPIFFNGMGLMTSILFVYLYSRFLKLLNQ